jgi:hypothetical protein
MTLDDKRLGSKALSRWGLFVPHLSTDRSVTDAEISAALRYGYP